MIKIILITLLILTVVVLCLYYLFPLIQICGNSMHPTLKDGEFYLSRRVFRKSKCKKWEVYVFRPPYDDDEQKFVIKRLIFSEVRDGKTYYFFVGDNKDESYDSRNYGCVDCERVVSRIIFKRKRGVK